MIQIKYYEMGVIRLERKLETVFKKWSKNVNKGQGEKQGGETKRPRPSERESLMGKVTLSPERGQWHGASV